MLNNKEGLKPNYIGVKRKDAMKIASDWITKEYGPRCKVLAHGCPICDKWLLFDILFADVDAEYTWNKKIRDTPDNETHTNTKIIVKISNGEQTYEEDVTKEQREHYNECISNGANKHLEKITFKHYTRPIRETLMKNSLDKYNRCNRNAHFIFGWMEAFSQGDDVADWMRNPKELFIEVINK